MSDTAVPLTTKKDWSSDQEVRWCPGCGDYGILQAVQQLMPDLGDKLRAFPKVLVPELNKGQLCNVVRGKYLVDARSVSKMSGLPFRTTEIEDAIEAARSAS